MRASTTVAIGVFCVVAAAVALIARFPSAIPSTGYFEQPATVGLSGLGSEGERFYVGLAQFEISPGDSVQFKGLDGLPVSATPVVAKLRETSSAIGVLEEALMDHLEAYKPLVDATLTAADGPFQILVVIPASSQDLLLSGPALRYSVNGQPAQAQRLLVNVLLCSREARVDSQCPPPNPPTQ